MYKILNNINQFLTRICKHIDLNHIIKNSVIWEAKVNCIVSILILIFNIISVVLFNYKSLIYIPVLNFFAILVLILFTSFLWNFDLCPEKKILKNSVNIQSGIRILMPVIYCVGYIINNFTLFVVLIAAFSFLDIFLMTYIKISSAKIKITHTKICEEISDWEKENYNKITDSISYFGIIVCPAWAQS